MPPSPVRPVPGADAPLPGHALAACVEAVPSFTGAAPSFAGVVASFAGAVGSVAGAVPSFAQAVASVAEAAPGSAAGGAGGAWLTLVGVGEDGVEGLGEAARAAIGRAALVVGGARHLSLVAGLRRGESLAWPSPMHEAYPAILARRGEPVVVLASGDPFWFGVGGALARIVPAGERTCLPGLPALSLACARLGWSAQDVAVVSLCGRPEAMLRPWLQPGRRLLVLCADQDTPAAVARLLCAHGFAGAAMHVMEALGGPRERVRVAVADGFALDAIAALVVVAVELGAGSGVAPGAGALPLAPGLADALFEHDGQITRREVRALTLSALAPLRGERLWDVGCGSGSVSVEWMLRDPSMRAVAVDVRADRAARAARNAAALGVPGLEVRVGAAPEALRGLAPPDAVFLGGGASVAGVVEAAWDALRPGGRLVANSVTLETDMRLARARESLGGTLLRLGIERLEPLGAMHGWRPAMTLTQWTAVKP